MCAKKKLKICLMTQAIIILSISIMIQLILCIIPSWVHVEIDGRNITVNKTDYYNNLNEGYAYNGLGDNIITDEVENDFNGTWWNTTNTLAVTEHRANRSYAIWYIGTCIDGTCYTDLYPDLINGTYATKSYFEPGYNFSWVDERIPFSRQKEFQMEVTIAVGVTFVAVFFISDHKRRYKSDVTGYLTQKNHFIRHYVEMGLIVLSGSLLWVPTMVYGTVNERLVTFAAQEIHTSTDYKPVTIHRADAVICATIGLILFAFAFILIFFAFLIKRKESQLIQTETFALNILGCRDDRQSVPMQPAPHRNDSAPPDYAQSGNILVGHVPFSDPVHAGAVACEPPPPSYEETMRFYKTSDVSNMYTKQEGKDT